MIAMINAPGIIEAITAAGESIRFHTSYAGDTTIIGSNEAAVQAIIDGYTVAEAISYRKTQVDALEAEKFDAGIVSAYGFTPPAAKMIKWPVKEAEAAAWKLWDDGGNVGTEPATPTIDGEVTVARTRAMMVAKIVANATALEGLRGAIELRAQDIKDELSAAVDFAAVAAIDISSGWPV